MGASWYFAYYLRCRLVGYASERNLGEFMPSLADIAIGNLKTALSLTDNQVARQSIGDLTRSRNKQLLAYTDAQMARLSVADLKKMTGV